MSHPSLVRIANVLDVSLDQLVCDSLPVASDYLERDIAELLAGCSPEEKRLIRNIMQAAVDSLREFP